jgi:hypothetical protein
MITIRDHADIDLGIADARGVSGDDHVAGHGQRHAGGARRAGERRDGRLAHAVLHVVHAEIQLLEIAPQLHAVAASDHLQIHAAAEGAVERACDDHRPHPRLVTALRIGGEQIVDQRVIDGVDRRAVHGDLRHPIAHGVVQRFESHPQSSDARRKLA